MIKYCIIVHVPSPVWAYVWHSTLSTYSVLVTELILLLCWTRVWHSPNVDPYHHGILNPCVFPRSCAWLLCGTAHVDMYSTNFPAPVLTPCMAHQKCIGISYDTVILPDISHSCAWSESGFTHMYNYLTLFTASVMVFYVVYQKCIYVLHSACP